VSKSLDNHDAGWRGAARPLLIPLLVFLLHALFFARWINDDAGISFAYAHNFIHGYGLVSQRGVPPVEGYSNPLWTFLISPLFAFASVDPTPSMKLLSIAFVVACFLLLARTIRILIDDESIARRVTTCVLLFIALNTSFVVWTTSGLENPLYAALIALMALCCAEWFARADGRTIRVAAMAGAAAAALALTRPDGIIFAPAFPVIAAYVALREKAWSRLVKPLTIFAVTAAAPLALYLFFRRAYFGSFLPNTYYAKGGPTLQDVTDLLALTGRTIDRTLELFGSLFASWSGLAVLLLILTVTATVARTASARVVALLPMLIASWAAFCLLPRDWMAEYRFATPFIVMLPLVAFTTIAELTRDKPSRFFVPAAIILGYCGIICIPRTLHFAADPTVPFALVAKDFGLRFNGYADDLGLGETTLLAPDLGGTLYFSRHRVYDLAGLCDPVLSHYVNNRGVAAARDYILRIRPTFIHMHTAWTLKSGLLTSPDFRRLYVPIWETAPSSGPVPAGDYVLRAAVHSDAALQRARMRAEQPAEATRPIPFPRDHLTASPR